MAKITKATFKSFVRKNEGKLLINVESRFDGMSDMVEQTGMKGFFPINKADHAWENNLGYCGIWLVGGSSRNSFEGFEENGLKGIRVWNCCGSFAVAVRA